MAFGFGFPGHNGAILGGGVVSLALTIATAPTTVGDQVVGQRAFLVHGTYNVVPDSYSQQWFSDGVAMPGETADNYLYLDTDAGHTITVGEVAHKAGYADAPLNMSA